MTDKPCKWTTESLYIHFTQLREADEKALRAALEAANTRLEGMNEWRQTVEGILSSSLSRKEGWSFLIGAFGLIFGVIASAAAIVAIFS